MLSCSVMSDSFVTPWTIACQAPLFMGFSRQEYWSGLPFPSPENLPNPGTEPESLVSPALESGFFTTEPPGKPRKLPSVCKIDFRIECFFNLEENTYVYIVCLFIYLNST